MRILNAKGPLAEDVLQSKENEWGVRLPEDYRRFLLQYNGGWPEPDSFKFKDSDKGSSVQAFFGIKGQYDLLDEVRRYRRRLPERLFPIAIDPGGNRVCISVVGDDTGKIYFWDHEMSADAEQGETPDTVDNIVPIADSFDEFLDGLHELQTA